MADATSRLNGCYYWVSFSIYDRKLMTRFADPLVVQCPHCGSHVLKSRLASFNDYGATTWSDGYSSAWGLNSISAIARCPSCRNVFWFEDAKELGPLPREPMPMSWFGRMVEKLTGDKNGRLEKQRIWCAVPSEWKNAQAVDYTGFPDLLATLKDTEHLTPLREANVRRKIWWNSSDHLRRRRDGAPMRVAPILSDTDTKENLQALLDLHERGIVNMPVENAEILRQLGRFEDAVTLLQSVSSDDAKSEILSKIMQFARDKDASIIEVWRSKSDV